MNAGKLNERIEIKILQNCGASFWWEPIESVWACAEIQKGKNLFSAVGIGVVGVKFTMRRRPICLHNAIEWNGKHCFLTSIQEIDRMYCEVQAAIIEPVNCIAVRKPESKDEYNRPVQTGEEEVIAEFPGCLTEKYLKRQNETPESRIDSTMVLVTPKPIVIAPGDLVRIAGKPYVVQVVHVLDMYKNEYEITVVEDV